MDRKAADLVGQVDGVQAAVRLVLGGVGAEGKAARLELGLGGRNVGGADGNVTVNDPNSPKNSETAWPLENLLPQIRAVWRYT